MTFCAARGLSLVFDPIRPAVDICIGFLLLNIERLLELGYCDFEDSNLLLMHVLGLA